jgi:hypothetical protein
LSLTNDFKGIFQDLEYEGGIREPENDGQDFSRIIKFIENKEENIDFISSEKLLSLGINSKKTFRKKLP